MLDPIYHMTLKLLLVCCFTSQATAMVMWGQSKLLIGSIFGLKMSEIHHPFCNIIMDVITLCY